MEHAPAIARRRVNLLLDNDTVAEPRSLGINLSRAAGRALVAEIRQERRRRWREENREWVATYNEWSEQDGDPLAHLEPL